MWPMHINLAGIYVDDQERALRFYTEVLGFVKKAEEALGAGQGSWLTVVSPAALDGTELLLEPDTHPAASAYKTALKADGIPAASFGSENVAEEHVRLVSRGVRFTREPIDIGAAVIAIFDDTCGNLIQITEEKPNEPSGSGAE